MCGSVITKSLTIPITGIMNLHDVHRLNVYNISNATILLSKGIIIPRVSNP